jgi:hypothetical protein
VRHARQEVNRWVVENRVRGLVCVRDADTGAPIEAPLTQIVLVADA